MTTRLMFLGPKRLLDSVVALKFDYMLNPKPDCTYIHCQLPEGFTEEDLFALYERFDIDCKSITLKHDADFLKPYNEKYDVNEFGNWIKQQLIKFLAIENCNDDYILVQDCDTALLEPYSYFVNGQPNLLAIAHESHAVEYYEYIVKFLNIQRQTENCFVTEFMPVLKQDWQAMTACIEQIHGTDWLSAIINQFRQDLRPNMYLWFSEYELLGNWLLFCNRNTTMTQQLRFNVLDADALLVKDRTLDIIDPIINAVGLKTEHVGLTESDIKYIIEIIQKAIDTKR